MAFDEDIRVDDAETIISAIRCIRHVEAVTGVVVDMDDWMNRSRIRGELGSQIWEVLYPKKKE